jgi:serine/threonine protein kinase
MQPWLEQTSEERPHDALPEGTSVGGYKIGDMLGRRGGFGITYFATNELHPNERYAIKEFFPRSLAVRRAGEAAVHPSRPREAEAFQHALQRFKEEALTLAKYKHPNIVGVRNFIAANGTAYLLMTYEEGLTLGDLLEQKGPLPLSFLVALLPELLGAIRAVHAGNYIHRDLKPSNIYIRRTDHSPVLLDFGAAREALGEEGVTSLTAIRTPGYAPHEQYFRKGAQGEWTDIYALGATLYCCVTGQPPPEATERKDKDSIVPAVKAAKGRYPAALLAAIDAMLAVDKDERPQTIDSVVALIAPRNSSDAPTCDPAAGGMAASADTKWMDDLRHRLAPLLTSPQDGEAEINDFFDAAKRRKWAGTRQFRRGRLPFLVSAVAFAIALGALVNYAIDPRALPIVFWGSASLTVATLAGGLALLAGIPLALIWYFRGARSVDPPIAWIWLASGATLLASVLLLYTESEIDRLLTGRVFRRDDYVLPAGLLAFAAAAALLCATASTSPSKSSSGTAGSA